MKILIVGAGIVGATLAFRLTRAGARVTVIEAARLAAGATGTSFGWINASFYLNPAHHHLRVAAMAAHHRLQADLPGHSPNWQGTLWWEDQGAGLDRMHADLTTLGYPVDLLESPAIALVEPALKTPPSRALRFPSEGAVDAAALTRQLLTASGATVLTGTAVTRLTTTGDRITGLLTPTGALDADHTILAAGTGTPALLGAIGIDLPLLPRPGLLLRTNPVSFRLAHILVTETQEIRQLPDGGLLTPCVANHQADTAETISDPRAATMATLARLIKLFGPVTEAEVRLAHRPVPADGLPMLGRLAEGLSLAVMHSGVTLAPLAAESLTAEIMGHTIHPLWTPYCPDRLIRPLGAEKQTTPR